MRLAEPASRTHRRLSSEQSLTRRAKGVIKGQCPVKPGSPLEILFRCQMIKGKSRNTCVFLVKADKTKGLKQCLQWKLKREMTRIRLGTLPGLLSGGEQKKCKDTLSTRPRCQAHETNATFPYHCSKPSLTHTMFGLSNTAPQEAHTMLKLDSNG